MTTGVVLAAVASHFELHVRQITSADRHRSVTYARHVAMYLCRRLPVAPSFPEIGETFGGRNHSTVIAAVRRIGHLVTASAHVAADVDALERRIDIPRVVDLGEMSVWWEDDAA